MKVCVPVFPGRDMGRFRLSSAGLGNLMTIWGRATVYAFEHGHSVAWPCWPQIHVGSWLRGEPDKRHYANIFRRPGDAITIRTLSRLPRFPESQAERFEAHEGAAILQFTEIDGNFAGLIGRQDLLWNQLCSIARGDMVALKGRSAGKIAVCIRLGDFKALGWATPVSWFVDRVRHAQSLYPTVPIWVHSTGSDSELAPILSLPNVSRAPAVGNALESVALISGSSLMIATGGSTFYRWAAFLGAVPAIVHTADRWQTCFWRSLSENNLCFFENEEPSEASWRKFLSAPVMLPLATSFNGS